VPILLLLDGLYPTGPVMEQGRRYPWDYMIVLPPQCLPSVGEAVESLSPRPASHRWPHTWRGRQQHFRWVNNIEYRYDHDTPSLPVQGVICEEHWQEVDRDSGESVDHNRCPVWISSRPLRWDCLHERCNLGARYRWGIATGMLVEKHQG
jgi:hypothetical protein